MIEWLKRKPYLVGVVLVVFILMVYLPSMNTYLRGDDFEWLADSYSGLSHPGDLLKTINHFFRPLVKVSYLANYLFFKQQAGFYNFTTILFHLINVFLLYCLMYRYFKRLLPPSFIALTFGISAFYSEVTLWSAGRPDSILLMFMLGVLLQLEKIEVKEAIPWHKFPLILFLTLMALGSKETWILLPVLAFLYLWIIKEHRWLNAFKIILPLLVLLILYIGIFILGPMLSGTVSPTSYAGLTLSSAIFKMGFLLFKYIGLSDIFSGSLVQYIFLVSGLIGLTIIFLKRNNRMALFGLLWMMITLGISLPIQYAPSRYNYLPLIGFWIMMVAFFDMEISIATTRYQLKKIWITLFLILTLSYYVVYMSAMLQWEIKDYRLWGSTHAEVVQMYQKVHPQIPHDKPLIFINKGTRNAVKEASEEARGYNKLLYSRGDAIWNQMVIQTLDSFVGHPFKERLEVIPPEQLEKTLAGEFTLLVFTDDGFKIADSLQSQVLNFYRENKKLPYKVEALKWLKQ